MKTWLPNKQKKFFTKSNGSSEIPLFIIVLWENLEPNRPRFKYHLQYSIEVYDPGKQWSL